MRRPPASLPRIAAAPCRVVPSCLCLITLFLVPAATLAQPSQSRARFLRWSYQDALALAQSANARTPLYLAGAVAMLTPVSLLDDAFGHEAREMNGSALSGYLNVTNELGGPDATLPVAGVFLLSLATDDARFQDAAFTSLQSLVYAGALSYGVKYTVGRFRPYEQDGPYRFSPFSGNNSFPSGHTTTAFAVLTPWVLYYPHPVTYGLFALGTGTAVARVARDKHWATDVLAGGALGFMTAYWLTRRHQHLQGQRISFTPGLSPGHASLQIRVKL